MASGFVLSKDFDGYEELFVDAALSAENNKRERALWGKLLNDKRTLQRRGFGVWWVGRKINVGNLVLTVKQFKEMAERERRLAK